MTTKFGDQPSNAGLEVGGGGTGNTSLTAYSMIAGGTLPTSALQQVSAGTSGALLKSNGASALPSFTTATYPDAVAAGSVLVANVANTIVELNSTSGIKVLQNNAGAISWIAPTGTISPVYSESPTLTGTISLNGNVGIGISPGSNKLYVVSGGSRIGVLLFADTSITSNSYGDVS